jgi:hypothetical protein
MAYPGKLLAALIVALAGGSESPESRPALPT